MEQRCSDTKENPCIHKKTSPTANVNSTNPTGISLGLNLDPYDNGMSNNLQRRQQGQQQFIKKVRHEICISYFLPFKIFLPRNCPKKSNVLTAYVGY